VNAICGHGGEATAELLYVPTPGDLVMLALRGVPLGMDLQGSILGHPAVVVAVGQAQGMVFFGLCG